MSKLTTRENRYKSTLARFGGVAVAEAADIFTSILTADGNSVDDHLLRLRRLIEAGGFNDDEIALLQHLLEESTRGYVASEQVEFWIDKADTVKDLATVAARAESDWEDAVTNFDFSGNNWPYLRIPSGIVEHPSIRRGRLKIDPDGRPESANIYWVLSNRFTELGTVQNHTYYASDDPIGHHGSETVSVEYEESVPTLNLPGTGTAPGLAGMIALLRSLTRDIRESHSPVAWTDASGSNTGIYIAASEAGRTGSRGISHDRPANGWPTPRGITAGIPQGANPRDYRVAFFIDGQDSGDSEDAQRPWASIPGNQWIQDTSETDPDQDDYVVPILDRYDDGSATSYWRGTIPAEVAQIVLQQIEVASERNRPPTRFLGELYRPVSEADRILNVEEGTGRVIATAPSTIVTAALGRRNPPDPRNHGGHIVVSNADGDALVLNPAGAFIRAALGSQLAPEPSEAASGNPVIVNAAGDALVLSDETFVTPGELRARGPQDRTYAANTAADEVEVYERSGGTDQTTDDWSPADSATTLLPAVDAIRLDGARGVTISFEADLFRRKDQAAASSGAVTQAVLELIATDGTTERVVDSGGHFHFLNSTIAQFEAARTANGQGTYGSNAEDTVHIHWTDTVTNEWALQQNERLGVRLRIVNQNGFASLKVRIRNFRVQVANSLLFAPPRWQRIMLEDFRLPRPNFGHIFNSRVPDDNNGNDVWLVKFSVPSGGTPLLDARWVIQAGEIGGVAAGDHNPYTVDPEAGLVTTVTERKAELPRHGLFISRVTTDGNDQNKFILSASTNFGDNAFCRLEIMRLR